MRHELEGLLLALVNVPGDVGLGRAAGEARELHVAALSDRLLNDEATHVIADPRRNWKVKVTG